MGTKSLLIGAHYPPHVGMVILAWRWLYGTWPTPKELLAIVLHDVGYLGCREMDGPDGEKHPALGARLARIFLGEDYGALIDGHSKSYAERIGCPLSRLYGPDKLSHAMEPVWWYVLRTRLTGELRQYRAVQHGCTPRIDRDGLSDRAWFRIVRSRMARGGISHAIDLLAPDGVGAHNGR